MGRIEIELTVHCIWYPKQEYTQSHIMYECNQRMGKKNTCMLVDLHAFFPRVPLLGTGRDTVGEKMILSQIFTRLSV